MSTPVYNTGNPYSMDDFAFNNSQNAIRLGSHNSNSGALTELEMADAAEAFESQNRLEEDNKDEYQARHGLDDIEADLGNLDEFSRFGDNSSEKVAESYFEEERRRRKKRQINGIKKSKRVNSLEDIESSVLEEFFMFLDKLWNNLTELADEAFAQINPFTNWVTQKTKKKKLKPPPLAEHPPLFIRESFKPKRSPHLWKSDPKPWWHLAFGDETNNKVVDNLVKYQNDTITADA